MDDMYQINVAKSEFREAYNAEDVDRLLSVFNPGGFTDMSEGGPTRYGREAITTLRDQLGRLFAQYAVKMVPIINRIVVQGDSAYAYGWHEFTLTPRNGRETIRKRQRYFELWKKDAAGKWTIFFQIDNTDVREELNGFVSHWFLSEGRAEGTSNYASPKQSVVES
jgi:ketosteroid isomerase-like protein